jgi:hypothetical protein
MSLCYMLGRIRNVSIVTCCRIKAVHVPEQLRRPRGTIVRTLSIHKLIQGSLRMCACVHSLNLLVTLALQNLNQHKIKETNFAGSINMKSVNIIAWRVPLPGNDCETNNETTPLIENRFLISSN